ncbi:NAD(P)-dependent oxidoreductase [Halobacteriovorax sp.]|uniref:NAD(P)-dependent oxidoreductase n=1 Tax=Halobacteriovorax sp. TaxID=2020862 RepID=UPI003568660D
MDTFNKLDIIRISTSSYQGEDFADKEKNALETQFKIQYKAKADKSIDHILITNSNTDTSKLSVSNKTKLIIHPNSGYDNFSLDFVKNCPCPIIIGNEIRMNAVVNYTTAALLDYLNKLTHQPAWDNSRIWNRSLLESKNILILGNGHIGSKVKSIVESLGGLPKIYDPFKGYQELDFENVDVILLCASLNPTSHKIINEKALNKVSKDLLIINGARGKLIDQDALKKFLKANKESFAYLDVFENEPYAESDFKDITNMCRTSHIAGVHNQLNSNIIKFECKIIESFLESRDIEEFKSTNRESLLQNRISDGYLI